MSILILLRRLWRWLRPLPERLEVTPERVVRYRWDGGTESIAWADLERVEIVTTDDGPFGEDFYWVLHGGDAERPHGVVVPNQLAVHRGLLEALRALPEFDSKVVLQASASVRLARFLCWQRPALEPMYSVAI